MEHQARLLVCLVIMKIRIFLIFFFLDYLYFGYHYCFCLIIDRFSFCICSIYDLLIVVLKLISFTLYSKFSVNFHLYRFFLYNKSEEVLRG